MHVYLHARPRKGTDTALSILYYKKMAFHANDDVYHVWAFDDDPIERIVARLVYVGTQKGKMDDLLINSHAAPGFIDIGTGLYVKDAKLFRQLRPYFKPTSRILVTGCNAGSSEVIGNSDYGCLREQSSEGSGLTIIRLMAEAADVPVIAGLDVQAGLDWSDPLIMMFPDGHYQTSGVNLSCDEALTR